MTRVLRTLALTLVLLGSSMPALANEKLVLIVSRDSPVEKLDSLQVRKLFLGLTVTDKGVRLRPCLNDSDPHLKEIFLQNIVSMSEFTYDHHLLGMALKQGKSQPEIFRNQARLYAEIAGNPNAVSFAWLSEVESNKQLKVLRVLWHD